MEDEDEDNGEISPDSLDPEPEDNFSNVLMQDKEQEGTNGVTLVGGSKYKINNKKTNTRIASPGAQLENSNYLYMQSHDQTIKDNWSNSNGRIRENNNFVSPR